MSTAFDIANAVCSELNAEFASEFAAVVMAVPLAKVEDLGSVKVTIVPRSLVPAQMTRSGRTMDVTVDVGIQKRVADDADIEAMADLGERVLGFLWRHALATMPTAQFIEATNDPIMNSEHLQANHVFTGLVSVTYRV